jgi:hypothetical protein
MKQMRYTSVYCIERQDAAMVAHYAGLSLLVDPADSVIWHVPGVKSYPPLSGYTEGVII